LAAFTGRWRNTKDIDLYISAADRDATVQALTDTGFVDYFDQLPYDRRWIYRATRDQVLVDAIWSMANLRSAVDSSWFARANQVTIRGLTFPVMPVEEFIWCKMYILQRDRCDWVDIFNILAVNGANLDYDHLFARLEQDLPLARGLLTVFAWLHPERASRLPKAVWTRLGLPSPESGEVDWQARVRSLDSRAWFSPLKKRGEKLDI
jgi:hypothetical protein